MTGDGQRGGRRRNRAAAAPARRTAAPVPRTAAPTRRSTSTPPAPRRRTPSRRPHGRLGDHRRRIAIGVALVTTVVVVLTGRLVQLQGLNGTSYANAAAAQRTVTTELQPQRGKILDASGRVLAYSVEAKALIADPKLVAGAANAGRIATAIAPIIGVPASTLIPKLTRAHTRFVYLARGLDPDVSDHALSVLTKANLAGLYSMPEAKRRYPDGSTGSNVLGFTNRDGKGVAGVEQMLDSQLAGEPGKLTVMTGAGGAIIPSGTHRDDPAVPGDTVKLTLDADLQYFTQQALDAAVRSTGASDGQITVVDAKTSKVLAMAAAEPGKDPQTVGNPNVQSVFEPGSANKVITFAAALQRKVVTPRTVLTVPDQLRVADRTIHDDWAHNPVNYTATGILAKSSNIGTLMIANKLGPDVWMRYAKLFGEGQSTGIGLPGATAGLLPARSTWSGSTFGNLPIGQGVAVSSLQLATMYQAIANGGVRMPPSIVESVSASDGSAVSTPRAPGTRVMSPSTAKTLTQMMEMVTQKGGTAPKAAIAGYTVAGKTGTGQKPGKNGYSNSLYWSTFAAFAPADAPRYVISIMVDSPQTNYMGGDVAAPLAHQVLSYALKQGGVLPTGARPGRLPLFGP